MPVPKGESNDEEQAGEETPLLSTLLNHPPPPQKRVSFEEWRSSKAASSQQQQNDNIDKDDGVDVSWRDDSTRSSNSWFPTATPSNSIRSIETSERSTQKLKHHNSFREHWESLYSVSSSERVHALQKPGVGAAAFLIRDAVLGQVENPAQGAYDPYCAKSAAEPFRSGVALVCGRLCAYRSLLQVLRATAWMLVLLTFIEPPHWCRQRNSVFGQQEQLYEGCPAYMDASGVPAAAEDDNNATDNVTTKVQYYPNSSTVLLTGDQANCVEITGVVIITIFLLLRLGRDGMSAQHYFRAGPSRYNRVAQLICIVCLGGGLATDYKPHHPVVRLVVLGSFLPGCQRDIHVLLNMLPRVFNVLTLLFVFMVFYAWFGVVMFVDSAQGAAGFESLVEAMWTLWICVTTANYPDVMMPSYNDSRWSAIYFVTFMLLTFFFLMNVILASVVNEYDTGTRARVTHHEQMATSNLHRAYALMDTEERGRIDRDTILSLFLILNQDFPEFKTLSDDDSELIFAILDKDGSSTITLDEFMDFGNVLLLEFTKTTDYATFVQVRFPVFYASPAYQRFCQVIRSNGFEYVIDAILICNAVIIGIQSYPELSGQAVSLDPKYWDGSIDTIWEYAESVFTVVYFLEVVVKVMVNGWKAYTESQKNMFDFTITVLAVLSSAYVYYPNEYSDTRLVRLIVMVRVLRLVRLLTAMKRFQLIALISAEIVPEAANTILVLFFLMYFFAAMGLQLYGGMITRDPENPLAYLILGTDFSDNSYWANNFNDMLSGMNVLFNLLVVNNWTECEVGFEAVTQAKWVRFFFLGFHVFGVILINNLVIAFIITNFLQQLPIFEERNEREVVGNGEALIDHKTAVFDATTVTGTKTNLSGRYIARLRRQTSDHGEVRDRDQLRRLFTQRSSEGIDPTMDADAA